MVSDTSFAAQRNAIFSDINAHLTKVVNLKIHLNTLTHIGQLPNEVLAEIFVTHARDCYRAAVRDNSWSPPGPVWVKVAHVCRQWREVALETPRFWSYVDVKKPKPFLALLPRSKSSPLSVDLTLDQDNWRDASLCTKATELIGQQSQRLRELRFVAKSKQIRTLLRTLGSQLPLLETLVLSDRRGGDVHMPDNSPTILPTDGRVPRLRHLELHRLAFMWTDPVFCPTLTTLVVVGRTHRGGDSPIGTFEQFIHALRAMAPSLVNLTLEQSVPRLPLHTTQPPPARNPSISLPSLQTLRVLCNTNDCVRFMDHLTINSEATMDLTGNSGTDSGIQHLVEMISAHASHSTPLLGLKIPLSRSAISIRGYRHGNLKRLDFDELGDIDLTFSTVHSSERTLASALRGAGTIFSHVRNLSLVIENGSSVPWPALFACTPSAETLQISGNPGRNFAEALSDVRDVQDGEPGATSGPLPRLRALTLDNAHFRRWEMSAWSRSREFFDELLDWTILRCNYGAPLERLQVWQCKYAVAKDIRRLREIVVDVEWDLWERDSEEDEDEDDDGEVDFYGHHNYHPTYGWY